MGGSPSANVLVITKEKGLATTITCDEEAWALLKKWSEGRDLGEVRFQGWPVLSIRLRGDDYQSSLNSGQMAALVELRKVFGRAYSVVAHGAYDMRRLRAEEDEQLEFTTTVRKGSSILDTDFTPLVQGFAGAIAANPQTSIVAAAVIGLALVSRPVVVKYFDERSKRLEAEERAKLLGLALNAQETQRYSLFEQARARLVADQPQFAQVLPDARDAFWRFASASVDADTMDVAGLELSQQDLEILTERSARRAGNATEVDGRFSIKYVRKSGAGFTVGLESKKMTVTAAYRHPQLTQARVRRLMNAMAAGQDIQAKLEVRVVEQSTLSGRLVTFTVIKETI